MSRKLLRPPFPWFGGKARVAHLVWPRFGEVRNYVEPFFGGGAVLLGRPGEAGIETVNDRDAYLANFWRAVQADPDQVAHFADGPVNEVDLHARHRWLVETGAERVERLKTDPDYHDAKVAGWWVWGQCLWIGSGWCAQPEWTGRGRHAGGKARGINRADVAGKRPALTGNGGGVGVHAPKLDQKRPVLQQGEGGRGVHRLSHQLPDLGGHGTGARGIHRKGLHNQLPDLAGDSGAAGRGIHASSFGRQLPDMGGTGCGKGKGVIRETGGLLAYMRALSDRLRRVRVCCGDFERILGPAVTTCIGPTGVFLDPPYPEEGRDICYNHDGDGVWWRAYQWAIDTGNDPDLRIALCGYEHPDAVFPPDWQEIAWKASGGYGSRTTRGQANARRERIWFSPHCLSGQQWSLW